MPGKVPDRWEEYSPIGEPIEGTRFIAFKVPLEEDICRRLSSSDLWFTPTNLIAQIESKSLKLGTVIDLTNTKRYYRPQILKQYNVDHIKLHTEGKKVPSKKVRSTFFEAVDLFLEENGDNGALIGVHCTHGLNRTGYLICRYMIDKLGFSPDEAILAFNTARGYKIEREEYVDHLRKNCSASSEEEACQQEPSRSKSSWRTRWMSSYESRQQQNGTTSSDSQHNWQQHSRHADGSSNLSSNTSTERNWRDRDSQRTSYDSRQTDFYRDHQRTTYSNNYWNEPYNSYEHHSRSRDDYGGQRQNGSYSHSRNHGYGQKPSYYGNGHKSIGPYGQFGRSAQDYGQFGRRHNESRTRDRPQDLGNDRSMGKSGIQDPN